ncbi:testis-expressed protein 47 [Boleophthalmus pectinirostris]|uniref:testis-expressed protein 47 n=1 Tax=Boleophthalmus pectinirostris TaxID=150288 RepID=UPI002431B03A|nr:testis-expressed protein 47 [Boleophthalmus pectinirostris]
MESLKEYDFKIEKKIEHRTTLFGEIMAKNKNAEEEEKILLQRLLLIARLPNGLRDRTELTAHYENLSLQLSKQFPRDNMTGLLLLYPSCLIHVIESSRDVLVTILEDLIKLQQASDCVSLEAPKIVFMAHNPHSRKFQQWSYKLLNADVASAKGTTELEKEPTETLVLQVLTSVETIAKQLEQAKRTEGGSALKDLGMAPDVLITLTSREDLLTPQQYLKLYNSPLHIRIDFGQAKEGRPLNIV